VPITNYIEVVMACDPICYSTPSFLRFN